MDAVIKEVTGSSQAVSTPKKPLIDENLLRAYLRPSHARQTANFHVRRTLDQYYYTFGGTEARDKDQLVYHRSGPKHERIFMVEELWLWIFDNSLSSYTTSNRS
jgi:hypothetical protein